MKKLLLLLVLALSFCKVNALPLGNPTEASLYRRGIWTNCGNSCNPCEATFSWSNAWSVRVGFWGDYVFDRKLEQDDVAEHDLIGAELYTNAGFLAFNICNRGELFATFGQSRLRLFAEIPIFAFSTGYENYKTHFSWSVGGRVTLLDCKFLGIGLEGQYFRTRPTIFDLELGNIFPTVSATTTYAEWQVGIGASRTFVCSCDRIEMVPYVGFMYARAKIDPLLVDVVFDTFVQPRFKSRRPWNFAVGTTFAICDKIGVTVEGRFIAERAVHVNGQIRF